MILFEIEHHKRYGVSVYGESREPSFAQAASLYHPDMVERSLKHDGSGVAPGIKDPDGKWDVRPHASRIVEVRPETLSSWHAVLENSEVPVGQTRMVYAVNKPTADVLDKLARAPRIGSLGLQFSRGWDESIDRRKGFFDAEWGVPESWDQVILQGPHLHVATPLYKNPNPTMLHNQDWTQTDFEALAPDAIPATAYKPRGDRARYDAAYTHWETAGGSRSAREFYRVAWRNMAANTGERTLMAAIIPPGSAHVHTVYDYGGPDMSAMDLIRVAASLGSIISDFGVRAAPKSSISWSTAGRLPLPTSLTAEIALRTLRLNCVTSVYSELWEECFDSRFLDDHWTGGYARSERPALGDVTPAWTARTPLRIAADRRQALVEIDALLAVTVGLTADELCTIYRTQFPVLYEYDRGLGSNPLIYDARGRLVPNAVLGVWRKGGRNAGRFGAGGLTATSPADGRTVEFSLPFTTLDRERDLRDAYTVFAARVDSRRVNSA